MASRKEKEEKVPGAVIPPDVEEYEQIFVKYRGRTVDVTASLNHTIRSETWPGGGQVLCLNICS